MRGPLFRRVGGMGHRGRVLDQAFAVAERHGTPDHHQAVHQRGPGLKAALQLKGDHAAEARHLTAGEIMLGEAFQARIVYLGH